jgi:hypothetical protein
VKPLAFTNAGRSCDKLFTSDTAGTNGSGKSAVLQAIQFCLGVPAAKTGRAGANVNFIRSGCHEAKVCWLTVSLEMVAAAESGPALHANARSSGPPGSEANLFER